MVEEWQLDFEWLKIRHQLKDRLGRDTLPDMNAILFLIGIQELGFVKQTFTKEEKQDLMHIAVCSLLSQDGYYDFEGLDHEGWPHYQLTKRMAKLTVKEQEDLLKEKVIEYFRKLEESDKTKTNS